MLSLYNQNICDKCGNKLPNKQLCLYDGTHQGRIRNGQKMKLCIKCCLAKLCNQLRDYTEKIVVVQPSNAYNTYAFYNYDDLLQASRYSIHKNKDLQFINKMKELLPPDSAKCECCGIIALYTWCSIDVYEDGPFSWVVNTKDRFDFIYLCKECLIDAFLKKVNKDGMIFKTIFPPLGGEGFLTPWEV